LIKNDTTRLKEGQICRLRIKRRMVIDILLEEVLAFESKTF
jgi:hypothetical protein